MIKIPLQKKPSQTMRIKLDEQNCILKVYFRYGLTFLDLTVDKTVVVKGAICQDRASITQHTGLNFRGSLHFVDLLGQTPPNYKEFGNRYSLLYVKDGEPIPDGLRW